MLRLLVGLTCLLGLSGALANGVLPASVAEKLASQGQVLVVVRFDVPGFEHMGRSERMTQVATTSDALIALAGDTAQVRHRFQLVRSLVVKVDEAAATRLLSDSRVTGIGLDEPGAGHLDFAVNLLGMEALHQSDFLPDGIRGQGTTVAVLDSGIEASHDDFDGALVDEACFCFSSGSGCCPAGDTTQYGAGAAADDHGHGTWVSGMVMSQGAVAPIGPAPDAALVSVKVLDQNNQFCCSSDISAAFDWLAVNHPDLAVVNASLGTSARFASVCDEQTAWLETMADAVDALVDNDTLVVASSGNDADIDGIGAPSCLSNVVAVGATYKRDYNGVWTCGSFADHDPRGDQITCYTNVTEEVELLAPGSFMKTSALGNSATLETLQGTSFAAPLVAGCVAQIRGALPNITASEVRQAMPMASAILVDDPRSSMSFPRLDCLATFNVLSGLIFADRFED